jgi:hypothetical protein
MVHLCFRLTFWQKFRLRWCNPLHKMNVPNSSHPGRVSGQSCAESAQDEAATFALLDDFRFIFGCRFSWPSFSTILMIQFIFD